MIWIDAVKPVEEVPVTTSYTKDGRMAKSYSKTYVHETARRLGKSIVRMVDEDGLSFREISDSLKISESILKETYKKYK